MSANEIGPSQLDALVSSSAPQAEPSDATYAAEAGGGALGCRMQGGMQQQQQQARQSVNGLEPNMT
ncbi:hypothetical protein OF846_005039 [Rhodotorula toruloides]|nr:hypothetical protein OF846_005039 [Rhodotorula toruloides]